MGEHRIYTIKIGGGLTPYMEEIADDLTAYMGSGLVVVTGGAADLDEELIKRGLNTGRVTTSW